MHEVYLLWQCCATSSKPIPHLNQSHADHARYIQVTFARSIPCDLVYISLFYDKIDRIVNN